MKKRYGLIAVMLLSVTALAACAAPLDEGERVTVVEEDAALVYSPVLAPAEDEVDEPVPAESATTLAHFRLEPEISGDLVLISLADAEGAGHVHFSVPGPDDELPYLGYMLDGTFYARAAVCPSCASDGQLSFSSDALVCPSCDSEFDLETGQCDGDTDSSFPEGLVPYSVSDGVLSMSLSDLVEAYDRTAAGEDTLFAPEVEVIVEEEDDDDRPPCCSR